MSGRSWFTKRDKPASHRPARRLPRSLAAASDRTGDRNRAGWAGLQSPEVFSLPRAIEQATAKPRRLGQHAVSGGSRCRERSSSQLRTEDPRPARPGRGTARRTRMPTALHGRYSPTVHAASRKRCAAARALHRAGDQKNAERGQRGEARASVCSWKPGCSAPAGARPGPGFRRWPGCRRSRRANCRSPIGEAPPLQLAWKVDATA